MSFVYFVDWGILAAAWDHALFITSDKGFVGAYRVLLLVWEVILF